MKEYDRMVEIDEFADDVNALDVEGFARQHGASFLIRRSVVVLEGPAPMTEKDWLETPTRIRHQTKFALRPITEEIPAGPGGTFLVYPIRKRKRGLSEIITVGRSPANDVCVGDMSVSKFHAKFELAEGAVRLVDFSTNGTWLGRERLEKDVPYDVESGKTICFGSVHLTYLSVEQFISFVKLVTNKT